MGGWDGWEKENVFIVLAHIIDKYLKIHINQNETKKIPPPLLPTWNIVIVRPQQWRSINKIHRSAELVVAVRSPSYCIGLMSMN